MKRDACFDSLMKGKPLPAEGWLAAIKNEAQLLASTLQLPGPKNEYWRQIDLQALYSQAFSASEHTAEVSLAQIGGHLFAAQRIVFVDGAFCASLSALQADSCVKVSPLGMENPDLHAHFAQTLPENVFAALNTRFFDDCAWVHVEKKATLPIHILHICTRQNSPTALYQRSLVVLDKGADACVIEEYVGLDDAVYFANAASEIVLQDDAKLRHIIVERGSAQAFHVGNCAVHLGKGSFYDATTMAFQARISRLNLNVALAGIGSEARLEGLSLLSNRQSADTHTRIEHLQPNCKSVQLHKCIAGDAAQAIFCGKIVVHPGAAGTNSSQSSRNLLLSPTARIDSQPQLEILNDDVSCRHGTTVGQLDREEIFYLKSRGISAEKAKSMLVYAFAAQIVERIPQAQLAQSLHDEILRKIK